MIYRYIFPLVVFILFTAQSFSSEWTEHSEIKALFEEADVSGTFVLYDLNADQFIGHNHSRAQTRYIPASTYKIANSLIGLSEGATANVDEILPYGGGEQFIKAWENDMSLRDAIKISNVPIYQELARRIGLEKMQENVARLNYGNRNIGPVVDRFWLDGPLKISAIEQAEFLARLVRLELPIAQDIQKSVMEIVMLEQGDHYTLYGKSGWTTAPDPGIGWWVGWIEHDGKLYTFALNIDVITDADIAKRESLTRAALKILNLL